MLLAPIIFCHVSPTLLLFSHQSLPFKEQNSWTQLFKCRIRSSNSTRYKDKEKFLKVGQHVEEKSENLD